MSSGLLDIERRVVSAAIESLLTWAPLTDLVSDRIVRRKDASTMKAFPAVYVECYNMSEWGLHTGNHLGGLRLGGMSYKDDDPDQDQVYQILGAFRSWLFQNGIVTILNNTLSARTAGSEVWFFECTQDMHGQGGNAAYITSNVNMDRTNEAVIEATIICMPSRPS